MFRAFNPVLTKPRSFPRVSGDVPGIQSGADQATKFSPRERGCSEVQTENNGGDWGFPRVSGDVPGMTKAELIAAVFSPRERGCSRQILREWASRHVFPA